MTTVERIERDHPGHKIGRSNEHDRIACITCDAWIESLCRCGGDRCVWFPDAPERPSMTTIEPLYTAPEVKR